MSQAAFNRTQWFRRADDPEAGGAMIDHDPRHTSFWNDEERRNGIFWLVNKSKGGRKKEDITEVISWAVDIDYGTKAEQMALINKFLPPSFLVQTKRGFQAYYDALNGTIENYDTLMKEHLVPNLMGDFKAADLARVLRVPSTYHWKDANDPYFVTATSDGNYLYTEADIIAHFPRIERVTNSKHLQARVARDVEVSGDKNLWVRIWSMDCEDALNKISGTEAMGHETVSFKPVSRGNLNIFINGKGTSCFIDSDKRIGSMDNGGPSIWQWINYYHRNHKTTYQLFKKYFPEVVNGKQ